MTGEKNLKMETNQKIIKISESSESLIREAQTLIIEFDWIISKQKPVEVLGA